MDKPVSKKRFMMVRKFTPPQECTHRIMTKDKERPHRNKFINWLKTFFGEGF